MIRFNSDYTEGCHPAILQKLAETNMEQTAGYGEDEYCEQARELIRKACGDARVDVHFLVGGTQTNVTVISAALKHYQGVITAKTGHINIHETGALEACGHKCLCIETPDGKLTAEQIAAYTDAHFADESFEHMVQPKMVYISNPTEIGTIYKKAELEAKAETLRNEIANQQDTLLNADRFRRLVDKYTDITELTPELVREFIQRIEIHERSGRYKKKHYTQQVDIYFNFIGQA